MKSRKFPFSSHQSVEISHIKTRSIATTERSLLAVVGFVLLSTIGKFSHLLSLIVQWVLVGRSFFDIAPCVPSSSR